MAVYTSPVHVSMSGDGSVPQIGVEAILRAQRKSAELLQETMRENADRFVGSRGIYDSSSEDRGEPRMRDMYFADLQGTDIIAYNNTAKADYFEFGTEPHEIWASGLFSHGQQTPARGLRGQFSRGARALKFSFPGGGDVMLTHVDHPGQEGIPLMAMSLEQTADQMEENIRREVVQAWLRERAGAG
jgi:hypothetical protein